MVLFGLRQNLAADVIGEMFDCGSSTVERYRDELEVWVDMVLTPLYEEVWAQAQRGAVLVDGLVVPVGERDGVPGMFSDKEHMVGQNVQVVATLPGLVADVGDPCAGAMHDSRAFRESGVAARWAGHYTPGGLGMLVSGSTAFIEKSLNEFWEILPRRRRTPRKLIPMIGTTTRNAFSSRAGTF